jgi:uncharacterized protein (DUF1697 family)
MADLRAAIAGLGYADVRTYLATGKVAFASDQAHEAVARRIEAALPKLGLRGVDVMVRTREELEALDGRVFEEYPAEEFRHVAVFTRQPVEIAGALPRGVRGFEVVATGAALLGVILRAAARPVNANIAVESAFTTRATTRWWNVVEDFRRDVLT